MPDGTQQIAVYLPAELYERLRAAAFKDRTSQTELVRQALEKFLPELADV